METMQDRMDLSTPGLQVAGGTGTVRIVMISGGTRMNEEGNARIAERKGGVKGTIVVREVGIVENRQMTEEVEMITGIVTGTIGVIVAVEVTVGVTEGTAGVIEVTAVVIEVTVGVIEVTAGVIEVTAVVTEVTAVVTEVSVGTVGVTEVTVGVTDGTVEIEMVIGVIEDLVAEVS